MESAGEWLEKALVELCSKMETGLGLGLDEEIIKGLVSYCDFAEPRDAKEYLDVTLSSLFTCSFSLLFCDVSICFVYFVEFNLLGFYWLNQFRVY